MESAEGYFAKGICYFLITFAWGKWSHLMPIWPILFELGLMMFVFSTFKFDVSLYIYSDIFSTWQFSPLNPSKLDYPPYGSCYLWTTSIGRWRFANGSTGGRWYVVSTLTSLIWKCHTINVASVCLFLCEKRHAMPLCFALEFWRAKKGYVDLDKIIMIKATMLVNRTATNTGI